MGLPRTFSAEELSSFQISDDTDSSPPSLGQVPSILFDPDGRLSGCRDAWVYADIDGNGEHDRVGRVSILEDTDGDGQMDASKIYR
jgi:hypothetical protein